MADNVSNSTPPADLLTRFNIKSLRPGLNFLMAVSDSPAMMEEEEIVSLFVGGQNASLGIPWVGINLILNTYFY